MAVKTSGARASKSVASRMDTAPHDGVSLGEIAERLGVPPPANSDKRVFAVQPLTEAGPDDLSLFTDARFAKKLERTHAGAVLAHPGTGLALLHARLLSAEHDFIDFALPRREPARDGKGSCDVGGVMLELRADITEHQFASQHRS